MTKIIKVQDKQPLIEVRQLLNIDKVESSEKISINNEQLLSKLMERYGVTKEKAEDELERRRKKLHRMTRDSGVPRPRSNFNH